jgi:RecA-family ATPase
LPKDQQRLHHTVAAISPRLIVLDPFVRLVRIDENRADEVSAVLGFLRQLQREHDVAVLVVHHARKRLERRRWAGTTRIG